MSFMFDNLKVYQKAVSFVDQIAVLTEQFPQGYGLLSDQLNRVVANRACLFLHEQD